MLFLFQEICSFVGSWEKSGLPGWTRMRWFKI